jgi:aquaglyceroporin related protein
VVPITGGPVGALLYDLCVFKGGQSPVNYSVSRWRNKMLKGERNFLKKGLRSKKHRAVERRLESGGVVAREDRR